MTGAVEPIFLLAHERSGTNLLRRILGRHPAIAAPPPIHLLNWLASYEAYYGDLTNDESFARLVEDCLQITRLSFDAWPHVATPADACEEIEATTRSLGTLFLWLYDRYTGLQGRPRWFCKDKDLIDHAYELAVRRPGARFVFMHRDPRDVFASYKAAPGGFKHAHPFAEEWTVRQERCLRLAQSDLLSARTFRLSYEDLLADPEATTRRLCEFLGEQFHASMLEADDRNELRTDNTYWRNISGEILRNNAAKYRTKLSSGEIRIVEERSCAIMRRLGYEPDVVTQPKPVNRLRKGLYMILNAVRQRWRARTARTGDHETETVARRQRFRAALQRRAWTADNALHATGAVHDG